MIKRIFLTLSALLLCAASTLAIGRTSPVVSTSGMVQACFLDGSIATGAFEMSFSGSAVIVAITPMTAWPNSSGNLADVYINFSATESKVSVFIPQYGMLTLIPIIQDAAQVMSWLQQVGGPPWTFIVTFDSTSNGSQMIAIRKGRGVLE